MITLLLSIRGAAESDYACEAPNIEQSAYEFESGTAAIS
jgi:hypothetical protein